jgi:N-acyl-D-amino-acid deacylase
MSSSRAIIGCAVFALTSALVVGLERQTPDYDLLLRHARVVDGAGGPWYRADVGVRDAAIVAIAPALDGTAVRTLDIAGLVVAPGFIDIHTHARRGIFETPTADNYVRQGVTTVVEGPDGSSPVPLGPFFAELAALPRSLNVGSFIGQGSVRTAVIGEINRPATPDEMTAMKTLVEQGMRDGAFGLSTGLFYVPGAFTPTAEVVALARVAGRAGGVHVSHMREEASQVLESVRETIAIGEQGGLPTQVTHHKIVGPGNWGRSVDTLRLVDEARARGVDVTIDQYPYTASSTSLQAGLLPAWALEGGRERLLARLKDPDTRAKIRADTVHIIKVERGGGSPDNVRIAGCPWDRTLAGLTLGELTKRRGAEPAIEHAAETAFGLIEQGGCQAIFHAIDEGDLERILKHPATMIASDGEVTMFGRDAPHPRSYGTFPRVLGVYVREKHVLTLEDAVRRMTSAPAQRLSLGDRGLLRAGLKADLVVFDPARVRDLATFDRPHQYAEGISLVMVNGQVVFENGRMTAARPGLVLYGPGRVRR